MAMQTEQKSVAVKPGEQQSRELSRSSLGMGLRPRRAEYSPFAMNPFDLLSANPFSIFRRMSEEMDRMFHEQMWEGAAGAQSGWSPAIEVSQRDGKFNIQAELPGLEPNDVKVEIENDSVVIQGERKSESEQKAEGMHRTERQYGYFYRSIPLPEGSKADQAQAKFRNGVLEVTVPMSEQASNKRSIPIQAEAGSPPKTPQQTQAA
ncbi:MAG TPA: Hsp20/alpha crystallin family protein [Edaphobacter sp.]|nr:Hsp20/alpha crystallin family protein [Edaphobacter sp.]